MKFKYCKIIIFIWDSVFYMSLSYLNRSAVGVTKIFDKYLWPDVVACFLYSLNNTNTLLMLMLMLQITVHKILTNSTEEIRTNDGDQTQFLSLLVGICGSWKWRNTSVATNTIVLPFLFSLWFLLAVVEHELNVKSITLWFSQMRGKTVWDALGAECHSSPQGRSFIKPAGVSRLFLTPRLLWCIEVKTCAKVT